MSACHPGAGTCRSEGGVHVCNYALIRSLPARLQREKCKVALVAVSGIGLMNLSLLTNPLVFYQIVKMLTIPVRGALKRSTAALAY